MAEGFAAGALLGHVYTLDDGTRVRLRMARASDLGAIGELLESLGSEGGERSAERFVYFDPREEYVVCATALIDGRELLLGVGGIRLDHGAVDPELVVRDVHVGNDIRRLLMSALKETATAISHARAA